MIILSEIYGIGQSEARLNSPGPSVEPQGVLSQYVVPQDVFLEHALPYH